MENQSFEGTGEIIRDGKDYLLVFGKDLAEKAGLAEGDQVVITVEQRSFKLNKISKD